LTKEALMTLQHAMIWFLITTIGLTALLAIGMYEGMHSYARTGHRRHWLRHH